MDFSSIIGALSIIGTAKEAAQAALAIRDFNEASTELAKLNDALLNSQNQALQIMGALLVLQGEKAELTKQVQKLEVTLMQRSRYTLFEISRDVHVYRSDVASQREGGGEPSTLESDHYACQPCLDRDGVRAVLQYKFLGRDSVLVCPVCRFEYTIG